MIVVSSSCGMLASVDAMCCECMESTCGGEENGK